jgi:phosphoglycerol transferase MdoB-like AlkP superfamily enzyme
MPKKITPELDNEIAQHADILPSIMGFLDYDSTYVAFGNDLFDPNGERYSINYIDGTYQLIKDGWSLHFDGSRAIGLYRLGEDEPKDLKKEYPEIVSELETFIKAIIQQYNYRLIHNQLQ